MVYRCSVKKSNRHGSKFVLDLRALAIYRMEESFCSGCECIQTDRVPRIVIVNASKQTTCMYVRAIYRDLYTLAGTLDKS